MTLSAPCRRCSAAPGRKPPTERPPMPAKSPSSADALLKREAEWCSHGDTVHYAENPVVFESSEGSFLYDNAGKPYLDLQMWYSAANLGYRNKRIGDALKKQIDTLPQLACQYLHGERIELAEAI